MFIGRFWSFQPERVPLVSFSRAIYRNNLLLGSKPGDRIAIVTTQQEEPLPDDRGRLIGMAMFGRIAVDTADIVNPLDLPARERNGLEPRCPKALMMLRAWRFVDAPPVPDGITWVPPRAVAGLALPLSESEAAEILKLPHVPVMLPDVTRRLDDAGVLSFEREPGLQALAEPVRKPVTTATREEGYVYAFRFGLRDAWKIGNSYESEKQLGELNRHIPHAVTHERWTLLWSLKVRSFASASTLERRLNAALRAYRREQDIFACDEAIFRRAWHALRALVETVRSDRHESVMNHP